jgi:hypothetical protein
VLSVVNSEQDFATELRKQLRKCIDDEGSNLLLELALAKDVGAYLVSLCYAQEGDSALLCTTSDDHWYHVKDNLERICDNRVSIAAKRELLPSVARVAE